MKHERRRLNNIRHNYARFATLNIPLKPQHLPKPNPTSSSTTLCKSLPFRNPNPLSKRKQEMSTALSSSKTLTILQTLFPSPTHQTLQCPKTQSFLHFHSTRETPPQNLPVFIHFKGWVLTRWEDRCGYHGVTSEHGEERAGVKAS